MIQLVRHFQAIPSYLRGAVITIGNFDGVHYGHQQLVKAVVERAQQEGLPSAVVLFEPQPAEYLQPDQAPARLTNLREKWLWLSKWPLDAVVCLKFNKSLATLSPEAFVDMVLHQGLATKHVIVGHDFHFGRSRAGDVNLLQQLAATYNIGTTIFSPVMQGELRVSSTAIRQALQVGDLSLAEQLMGHPYTYWGRVIQGEQRGRQLGFPTANFDLKRPKMPVWGVFAVEVAGLAPHPLPAVANIGVRPTVGGAKWLLEVHIFDFNDTIYGRYLRVTLRHKLRDEQKFASLAALQQQIQSDCAAARSFFGLG